MWHLGPSCVPEDSSALPYAPDSIHHDPGRQPNCHASNLLGYIRSLEWARIISITSAPASTTSLQDLPPPLPLLLLLDVPFPDFFLYHPACIHQEDSRLSLASRFTYQDRACKCTVDFHSLSSCLSRRARKCTIDFHSQVQSHLKNMLASALLTFTNKTPHCWLLPFGKARPLWAWFCSCRSIRSDTGHSPPGVGCTLCFPIFLWRKFLLNWASPCHLVPPNKINRVLFPLTVLRSFSFLIPSFTKVNMSSDPVVHLSLTYAWGLLGACHRDG